MADPTVIGDVTIYRVSGTGHSGSRSQGSGWWGRLSDGRYLAEDQRTGWPPYPVIAVTHGAATPRKTKREVVAMADRYYTDDPG